jgi:transcriptional regulator with XRE-family HTH domain
MATGSTTVRRSLGRRLKQLREQAGKTYADVVDSTIASKAKLARIEAGQQSVKVADVRALCWLYEVDQNLTDQLADLSLQTARKGWWEAHGDAVPSWFTTYVERESAALEARTYQSDLIPGLLQTPDYHRSVFEAARLQPPDSAERQVQLRVDRQHAAFDRLAPLALTAVLSEAVLAREIGGTEIMAEQRKHLLELSRRVNIAVYILPFGAGAHPALKGAFTVLGFDSPDDPDLVYLETSAGGRYIEEPTMLLQYREDFTRVRNQSVPIEEYLK